MKIKLSDRERWLVFFTVLFFFLYFFYLMIFASLLDSIGVARNKARTLTTEVSMTEQKANLLEKLQMSPLFKLRERKGREEQTMEALKYISEIVSKVGIDLKTITPSSSEKMVSFAKAVVIQLNMSGDYNSLYRFLKELDGLPILLIADSVVLTRGAKGIDMNIALSVYY